MAIREILQYPHPVLRQACQPVSAEQIHSAKIQQLIVDLIETMYAYPGTVGIAAPQVGEPVQLFVMDATAKTTQDRLFVVINPVIASQSQWKFSREGCLSFPDYLVTVKRARKMTAEWQDAQGNVVATDLRDFEAIIFQHEHDHLNGILFLDRVKNMQADVVLRHQF